MGRQQHLTMLRTLRPRYPKLCLGSVTLLLCAFVNGFTQNKNEFVSGSYNSFGPLKLEDNSMFIEEAFNQQMGSVQYISTGFVKNRNDVEFSFTAEIPLTDQKHQLSYTLNYYRSSFEQRSTNGFGDVSIGYRYQIFDQSDWLMLIPRLSVILPTGNASMALGSGAFGLQTNVAITKRVSRKIVFHYNAGVTEYFKSDFYTDSQSGKVLAYQKNVFNKNLGASVIWHPIPSMNTMLEYVALFEQELHEGGNATAVSSHLINPALRFSIFCNNIQIVPGISFPLRYNNGIQSEGVLFYLSIETNYQ